MCVVLALADDSSLGMVTWQYVSLPARGATAHNTVAVARRVRCPLHGNAVSIMRPVCHSRLSECGMQASATAKLGACKP